METGVDGANAALGMVLAMAIFLLLWWLFDGGGIEAIRERFKRRQ